MAPLHNFRTASRLNGTQGFKHIQGQCGCEESDVLLKRSCGRSDEDKTKSSVLEVAKSGSSFFSVFLVFFLCSFRFQLQILSSRRTPAYLPYFQNLERTRSDLNRIRPYEI